MKVKKVHIFGGGTVAHIANHLALTAPAYGTTAKRLAVLSGVRFQCDVETHLTKMAGGTLETNEDVQKKIDELKADTSTRVIFFNCALVDWKPTTGIVNSVTKYYTAPTGHVFKSGVKGDYLFEFGKYNQRLTTHGTDSLNLTFTPAEKIISSIRNGRKDIFLVGFKTTCGATKQEMFEKGLTLCKESSVNLVLVNDTKTHWNMIVTPEEAAYHETQDRDEVLRNLVDMAYYRSHLTFTQSTVISGTPWPWETPGIPQSLKTIVEYCIKGNAYKPFKGATVGHFAVKLSDKEFLTSIRKSNFNDLAKTGMVYVRTDGPDTVIAYGAKPSVGGQSQRIVFNDHPGMDCIVHFHCPLKDGHPDDIPVRSQREVECGSHQCGKNTSDGLKQFGNLKVVMLDQHGPNIVFNKNIDPNEVIAFIERNFDLSKKTGGYHL